MRFESFLLDRLAKAKQLARELSTKRAAQTEWLIAVFLDRLVRAASELEPGTQIARRLDDARNRLLDEVRGLLTDAAWRRQHHQLLESLFAAPAEPQRDAAREVLKVLTARAAAGFAQHPAAGTQFLDTVARLEAAVPTASFAPPPTTPELMLAFLRQVMLAAAERQGKNRRQWEEKTQRYGSLLEAAAAELATDGVSAGVHGQLLRKLFIDPTEPVREDAAKLLPLLVEKARIRLNKEPATGKPHELEAVRTSLTSAFANTHFRLPAPPNPPEVATEERPGEGPGAITPPSLAVSAPVSKAVTTGDEEVADPKLQEKFMRAVKHGALATVRELLAAYPALVHLRDADGDTPLHHAAGKGHTKVLKLLLEFGADVNAQNPNGETPLHQAVRGEQDKVAELGSGLGGPKNQGAGLETQLRNAGGAVQQLAIVEKQRDTAVGLVEQHRREADALRNSQSTAQREINTLRSELDGVRRQLTQAQSDLQRQADRLRGAEEARDRYSRERDAASEETRRLRIANESGSRELASTRGEVQRLNGQVVAAGKHVEALEGQLEVLSQEMQHRSAVEAEKGSFGIDRLQQSLMLQAESEQARQREAVANSSIQALRAQSEAAEATAAKLKRRVSELEAQIAGIQTRVQDADFAFLEKLNGKLAEIKRLEAKSEVAVKELKQREGDLRKLADQFRVLKETCARLQQELDARDLTLQSVTASGQAMRQLDALARRLLEAQDNIRTRYADEGVAHRTSLLLNHSLTHLALATAAGDDARRAAMLANLFRIGTGLQAVEQFPAVLNSLRSMEPEIETLGERLQVNGASRPGRALFERVVNLSRAQSGLALGPFHYDVDQHGMVYSTG